MADKIKVDFTGVESGGGSVRIPEGDYGFEIKSVKAKKSKEAQNPMLLFGLKITNGDPGGMGKTVPHRCMLQKNSLWNLRNLLEACGKEVPSKAITIDPDKLIGLKGAGTVIDEEYEGKKKSIFTAFFPISELNTVAGKKSKGDEVEEGAEETEEEESTDEEEELFG